MANTVRILRSSTAGAVPSSLVAGQIAINESSGTLFYRSSVTGLVTTIAGGSSGSSVAEYSTPAAFPATGAAAVLYITDAGRLYRWASSVYVEVGTIGGISALDGGAYS